MAEDQSEAGFLSSVYWVVGCIVFALVFFGSWIHFIISWGLFFGFLAGWIPSLFIAAIIAFVWPVLALIAILIWLLLR